MIDLTQPAQEPQRDRWGRPYVVPADGGKAIAYTRATTIAGALDDKEGLMRWKQRMAARGIVARPDLAMALGATSPDDTKRLDEIVAQAADAAGSTAAATVGTALHEYTERLDRGQPIGAILPQYEADIAAYKQLAEQVGWQVLGIEQFVVMHPYKVAGTLDRLLRIDGQVYVGDLKTSQTINYPGKFAVQISLYAHSQPYDVASGTSQPWPDGCQPSRERGVVIHMPSGQGRASLHWVDLTAGWEAACLAFKVREWHKRTGLLTEFEPDRVLRLINVAPDLDTLNALWALYRGDGWGDEHTLAAKARKAIIESGADA